MKFFKPKRSDFFDLFKEVGNKVGEISALFQECVSEFKDFGSYAEKAKSLEHSADEKTDRIVELLNRTFITPFDREDIYILAHELDDIVDLVENAIHNMHLYKFTRKISAFDEFAKLIVQGSVYTERLITCMEMQKITPELSKTKVAMHELEDQGDKTFAAAISRMFEEEKDPIVVIKEKDILECLENIIDKYKKISDITEGLLIKSS